MAKPEQEPSAAGLGLPVEQRPSSLARVSQLLFYSGVLLAVFGPVFGYGMPRPFESILFWAWIPWLVAGGGVGLWDARRGHAASDEGRRYAMLNWAALAVVGLLWLAIAYL